MGTALLVAERVRDLLFTIDPHDPATFVAASLLVALVATASFVPARRAASVDPTTILRAE